MVCKHSLQLTPVDNTTICLQRARGAEHAWYEGPASLWDPMPILTIRHVTSYHYRQPVAFGEHRMMLRPRDDGDQRVLVSDIEITPKPSELAWTQDHFGNHVAVARFAHRASELRFESSICVDHVPAGFRADDIADYARSYPFTYAADEGADLVRFITQEPPGDRVARWAAGFLREDGMADTQALLVDMTQSIRRAFRHGARYQQGTRTPEQTLELASGALSLIHI